MKSLRLAGLLPLALLFPIAMRGQDPKKQDLQSNPSASTAITPGAAQLFDRMGPYHREFTTDSKEAQQYLNQGMIWMQAFNHEEAKRSFLKAAELDPNCAMAWWGVAYCEGPNYNDPRPDDNRSRAAWYALQNAVARIAQASQLERDLIIALKSRYSNPWPKDRAGLDQAYAEAMAKVWAKYPTNSDVGTLYAEAMMQRKPWKLYSLDRKPAEGTMEIRAVLEKVMALDPLHPGAKHFYIHTVEASARPDDALKAARELNDMVPASGHLLHMPSHIYIQTGDWQEAIDQNVKAVESDVHYRSLSPALSDQYGYEAHNAHMLVFAAMMIGQEKTAMKYARAIWEIIPKDQMKDKGPSLDSSLMCVYDVQKRFGRWDDILAETEPAQYLPITRAYWRAQRAVAYAAKKNFFAAEKEFAEFLKVKEEFPEDSIAEDTFNHRILKVSEHFIQGEIALQKQDWPDAIWHLKKAVEVEDTLIYSEPPYWLQPVRHTLGAVYMKAGMFPEAEATYRKDLSIWRDNGWSLYGLSQALAAQGKTSEAAAELEKFKKVWVSADEPLLTTSCKCLKNLERGGQLEVSPKD
jgi:tetratricopeptide (TPR) repeat protein